MKLVHYSLQMKIGRFVQDVKCTDLQEHTIVEFAGDVFDEWIIIVHGSIIAWVNGIKNIFCSFYFT